MGGGGEKSPKFKTGSKLYVKLVNKEEREFELRFTVIYTYKGQEHVLKANGTFTADLS